MNNEEVGDEGYKWRYRWNCDFHERDHLMPLVDIHLYFFNFNDLDINAFLRIPKNSIPCQQTCP